MFGWEVNNAGGEVDARMHACPMSRAPQRKMKASTEHQTSTKISNEESMGLFESSRNIRNRKK